MRLLALVSCCALLGAAPPVAAQVSVSGVRDLAFGSVIVGIPSHVAPSDPVRSGHFRFTAPVGERVRVRFDLPNWLDGPAGARLRISFSNSDAIAVGLASNGAPVVLNPHGSNVFQIVTSTTIQLFIGGTVSPAANQGIGNYSGTIILTVTIL